MHSIGATVFGIYQVVFASERIIVIDDELTILSQMTRLKYPLTNFILVWDFRCNEVLAGTSKKKRYYQSKDGIWRDREALSRPRPKPADSDSE
jgi:hypothetical protein